MSLAGFPADRGRLRADSVFQGGHLNRGQRRFKALVAHFQSGAINGLFERVAGKNAESMWNAGFLRGLPNTARDFVDDDIIVGRVSAKQASDADDGVVFLRERERARGGRNLEGARHANYGNIVPARSELPQSVARTDEKSFCNEGIEARDNDGEATPSSIQITLHRWNCWPWRQFNFQIFFVHNFILSF